MSGEHAEALEAGNRLERENHAAEAAEAYAKAANLAERPRTRDWAAYRQARQLEKAGDRQAAVELYLAIAERDPGGEMASRCIYYAGRMAFEDDDVDTGLARMRRVAVEYHHKGLAPQAVRRAVQRLADDRGDDAAIAWLRELEAEVRGTDVGDSVLFRWAMIEKERGNWQQALERLDQLDSLYQYPESTIWDDAMWEAGQIANEHGEHQRALRYLRTLVSWRENSIATGTYYTDWTDDAQLLIGRILLEELDQPDEAISAFELLATFPDSTLADDGLLWAARAQLTRGDSRRACRTLDRLLRDFPYSNKQRQARELAREHQCPGAR